MQKKASLLKITATCVALFGLATANAQLVFDAGTLGGTAGSSVTSWTGASPSVTLNQDAATAPTLGVTGTTKYVDFNDTDLKATGVSSGIVGADQSAIFMVFKNTSPGGTVLLWTDGTRNVNLAENTDFATAPNSLLYVQGLATDYPTANTVSSTPTPAQWTDGQWHVLSVVRNGGSAEMRIDGTPLSTTENFGPTPLWNTTLTGDLYVGGSSWKGSPPADNWDGDIAEIQIYSTVPGDINAVELALGAKYSELGLTVVPEPSEYAMIFGLACVAGALALRYRRQQLAS